MKILVHFFIVLFVLLGFTASAQNFTHQDTLRGSIGKGRLGWNVLHYNILVEPDIVNQSLQGSTTITFLDTSATIMQIDLQEPMVLDKVFDEQNKYYQFTREGNVYWVYFADAVAKQKNVVPTVRKLTFLYHGKVHQAKMPPWDGGWIFSKDSLGNPWLSAACQGIGASVWFPCKDHQSDKPDNGVIVQLIVPDTLVGIANGNLIEEQKLPNQKTKFTWQVTNPINTYCVIPYIGKYAKFSKPYAGKKGNLDLQYFVLPYHLEQAQKQFLGVDSMLKVFENAFGAYPFYKDSYKLVEAPYLGMENQSNIAYGNEYKKGYLGKDLSGTCIGLRWDFIIVHESGHEWFGNNITTNDIADMWVHEAFTTYSEVLYIENYWGSQTASNYLIGTRKNIQNDKPIIGYYGVNKEGSSDMYNKGANMLHTIRQVVGDTIFKQMLLALNQKFYHSSVNGADVEQFMNVFSGKNLKPIFDQYLRTTQIPTLEIKACDKGFTYQYKNSLAYFQMPVIIEYENKPYKLKPTTEPQCFQVKGRFNKNKLRLNPNYYIEYSLQ